MEYKGWTVKDLVSEVGMSERSAYYLQDPSHEPTSSMLLNISEKMQIRPEELIELDDEEKPNKS